MFNLLMLTYC